ARQRGVRAHEIPRPLVIAAARDHELQRVGGGQERQILEPVPRALAGAGRLDVDDAADARIDDGDVVGASGLETYGVSGIAQSLEQRRAARLRERLAAGHADVPGAERRRVLDDLVDRPPRAAAERVSGIAVAAAQRAAGQPNEDRRPAGEERLAL